MKRTFYLILAAITAFSISGCKKIWDYINSSGPGGVVQECRIAMIENFDSLPSNPRTFYKNTVKFIYNPQGNLTEIRQSATAEVPQEFIPGVYRFDSYFNYDSQNRLKSYVSNAGPSPVVPGLITAAEWHWYTYTDDYNIIDTIAFYTQGRPLTSNYPDNYSHIEIEHIKLDTYGRVAEVKEFDGDGNYINTTNYSYDASGNLIAPGATYTDKMNMYQTSKTLMFVYKDYSVNDRVGNTVSYNNKNLPKKLEPKGQIYSKIPLFNFDEEGSPHYDMDHYITVSYDCKQLFN
ncbi:MAG: hypothetical protein H3C48_10850 [Chitinophagaceae bacterium]|nr:hypothetical protein [Chitinophagaceae bacterium]